MTSPLTTAEIDELEARVAYCEYVHGTYFEGAPIENVLLRRLLASARMGVDGWQDIETAPKDGTRILAIIGAVNDERWGNLGGRIFEIRHEGVTPSGYDLGWSVYPGFGGVPDRWFAGWRPLPEPPAIRSLQLKEDSPDVKA